MPLKNYADARTLVIRSFGDLYNRDTRNSVTMIDLSIDYSNYTMTKPMTI